MSRNAHVLKGRVDLRLSFLNVMRVSEQTSHLTLGLKLSLPEWLSVN